MDQLYTSQISSSRDSSSGLTLLSDKSVTLTRLDTMVDTVNTSSSDQVMVASDQVMVAQLEVKHNMEMTADNIMITDTQGDQVLVIDREAVRWVGGQYF